MRELLEAEPDIQDEQAAVEVEGESLRPCLGEGFPGLCPSGQIII